MLRIAGLAALLLALGIIGREQTFAQDLVRDFATTYSQEGQAPMVDAMAMGPIAVVGHARIGADQVFELWTPAWSETQAKVRNGKMTAAEGDRRLQVEWEKALLALVKDEMFFQEADREHSSFVNSIIDRVMRGGADRPRAQVAAEIRRAMEAEMQKFLRQLNADVVRESGGMLKLNKVLESRRMTFSEWQTRLKKKAFTQTYLHQILSPRTPDPGPKQIQQYYAAHQDEYSQPGTVKFQHIFLSNARRGEAEAREDAAEIWEQLADGEIGFEEAAAKYSDDPESKARGGLETEPEAKDLEREAWLSDIRNALREEKPGELGPILESPFGCHIAKLISIGPRQKTPFAEVRREIERKLQAQRWDEETDKYFASIRKNTPVQVLYPTFPQHLSCAAQEGMPRRGPRVINTSRPEIHAPKRGR